jgi:hypothetical protein
MSIDGSGATPATRLTSGPAFDMQPRFRPDGKRIAMSTDRDGLWNIWTMEADGKDVRQVSREKRWFVNSPTWSPDGAYVYARRHFVKARSLGAGEIWCSASRATPGSTCIGRATAGVSIGRSVRSCIRATSRTPLHSRRRRRAPRPRPPAR